ncbi:hypothetical protein, partial [Maritalea porphyrae]|uniref:hypothetical protein n=1 Tax=Maritalea porphyrae TaxID=880732 RepID=UPI0022B0279E
HRRACRRMDRSARQSWLDKLTMRLGEAQKLPRAASSPSRVIPDLVRDPGENNRQQMRSWFTPAWFPACAGMTDNIGASVLPKFADRNERTFTVRPRRLTPCPPLHPEPVER